jgi:hypothetical protein
MFLGTEVTHLSARMLRSVCFDTLFTSVSFISLVANQKRCVGFVMMVFTAASRSLVANPLRRRWLMFLCFASPDSLLRARNHGARGCQW